MPRGMRDWRSKKWGQEREYARNGSAHARPKQAARVLLIPEPSENGGGRGEREQDPISERGRGRWNNKYASTTRRPRRSTSPFWTSSTMRTLLASTSSLDKFSPGSHPPPHITQGLGVRLLGLSWWVSRDLERGSAYLARIAL
jgi:hypothetical protein